MTALCPVCGGEMSPFRNHRSRTYCGKPCRDVALAAYILARESQVDPVVVDRLVGGQSVTSTRAERVQATKVLLGRGRSYRQVAAALHVTPHTVWRYVVQLRQPRKAA
jgi:hypothetical protein